MKIFRCCKPEVFEIDGKTNIYLLFYLDGMIKAAVRDENIENAK